ncbi:acyl-CoA carboxylase epsilon subunit [Nocardia thailandica]|uniref:Acyl-CoA carboxylase epsilon subunit n=1 Tax=Nocardia thailandica TaxID=257275 RepID=A0ABW6PKG5_9NOCA|nr:acyl-CoA carboxylase epsilon subunit [Nocardia thailandica]
MAEEDVLTAAELELAVDPIVDEVDQAATAVADVVDATGAQPAFRIVKGNPSDEEIAALVAVFAAASSGAGAAPAGGPRDSWGVPTLLHRGTSPFSPYAYPLLSHLR